MYDDATFAFEAMMDGFECFKAIVRDSNKNLYDRWKAGGFLVDTNIVSMYPNAQEVLDSLDLEEEEE
jgi:hypothetical protein